MLSTASRLRAVRSALRGLAIGMALVLASSALPLYAQQPDLSGSWLAPDTEDSMERHAGPLPGDWTGMPLSTAGLDLARSYEAGMLSEPYRICQLYNQWELADGPWQVRFWPIVNRSTAEVEAWRVEATESQAGLVIWVNGRPVPSKYAPHPRVGFTTGHWLGSMLIANTTHMKMAPIRRNGAFNSGKASLNSVYIPHGNMMTAVYTMHDPVYLTEPYIYSRPYDRSINPSLATKWPPCIVDDEGVSSTDVPFFLPGQNPLIRGRDNQMMKIYHIPTYATQGGAATMYPAFRNKLKAEYLKLYSSFPKKCTLYCSTRFRGLRRPPAKRTPAGPHVEGTRPGV